MEAVVDDKSNELNVDVHNVEIMENILKDSTRIAEENFQSSKYMDHINRALLCHMCWSYHLYYMR